MKVNVWPMMYSLMNESEQSHFYCAVIGHCSFYLHPLFADWILEHLVGESETIREFSDVVA